MYKAKYTTDKKTLVSYIGDEESFIVPEGVEIIGKRAFGGYKKGKIEAAKNLKHITLPSTLKVIEASAFFGCQGLTHIDIPKHVNTIAQSAFIDTGLTDFHLPASVIDIDLSAIRMCPLKTVSVEVGHPIYDSRDNCNAIIDTRTGEAVITSEQTQFPDGVWEGSIGEFRSRYQLHPIRYADAPACPPDEAMVKEMTKKMTKDNEADCKTYVMTRGKDYLRSVSVELCNSKHVNDKEANVQKTLDLYHALREKKLAVTIEIVYDKGKVDSAIISYLYPEGLINDINYVHNCKIQIVDGQFRIQLNYSSYTMPEMTTDEWIDLLLHMDAHMRYCMNVEWPEIAANVNKAIKVKTIKRLTKEAIGDPAEEKLKELITQSGWTGKIENSLNKLWMEVDVNDHLCLRAHIHKSSLSDDTACAFDICKQLKELFSRHSAIEPLVSFERFLTAGPSYNGPADPNSALRLEMHEPGPGHLNVMVTIPYARRQELMPQVAAYYVDAMEVFCNIFEIYKDKQLEYYIEIHYVEEY